MRILVTGASGYIGSFLVRHLLKLGHEPVANYRREQLSPALEALKQKGVELWRQDLALDNYELPANIDGIIHAAAIVTDWGSPEDFEKSGPIATSILLAKAELAPQCSLFTYISSVMIYGSGTKQETAEDGPFNHPLKDVYSKNKWDAESLSLAANTSKLKVTIARVANVYGPEDTTVFYHFMDFMEKGIMGYVNHGKSLTSSIYIDDVVDGISKVFFFGLAGEAYNISSRQLVSWRELTEMIAQELNLKYPRLSTPKWLAFSIAFFLEVLFKLFRAKTSPPITRYRISEVAYSRSFSTVKAERELGFVASTNLEEGISKMVKAYRAR